MLTRHCPWKENCTDAYGT